VTDIVVPVARIVDVVVCDEQVPWDLHGDVCGYLRGKKHVEEFAYAQGRAMKPKKPLMVYGPDNYVPILVIGGGDTEASEMQDLALAAIDKQEEQMKRSGRGFNFDEVREQRGMARREDFGEYLADALSRYAKKAKDNGRIRSTQ